jgi:hypothetical protein
VVGFKTNDNAGDPLPDPMLLRLRAYTTQCAFSKAAGEKTGQVWYDEEEDIAAGSMFDEAKTFFYGHSEDQYTDARDDEESNVPTAYRSRNFYANPSPRLARKR